jgi:GTP cyclohydrolase II
MSDMKFQPIVESGIEVVERVEIPEALIPEDAKVEMAAKKAAGYFTKSAPDSPEIETHQGRRLDE